MENPVPGPSKGYQKKIKKDGEPAPKINPEKKANIDYSSPMAKKWPLLLDALESGNVDSVKKYIEEGMNVNIIRNGVTPLMIAASKGHREVAEVLIQSGVNINERSDDGWTALHKAAFDQQGTGIVELLMQSGAVIEARNKAGKTALQLAEEKGRRDIVVSIKKHLEKNRGDALEWEEFLKTPEGKPYRLKRQHESLTRYAKLLWLPPFALGGIGLLAGLLFGVVVLAGIIGTVFGLLVVAFYFVYERTLSNYLEKYEPLPSLNIHILRDKRNAGEQVALKENRAEYAHSDALPENKRILKIVAAAAVLLVVLLLIGSITWIYRDSLSKRYYVYKVEKTGARFSDDGFLNEVSKNNEEVVELFLKAGISPATVNEKGQTALMIAAEKGYINILNKLAGPNAATFNRADASGNTALMLAARHGREPVVQALLENGVDVNYTAPSHTGAATALQAALDVPEFNAEHKNVLKYLLEHGAEVKGRNTAGQSPLLFAAEHGREDAAKMLIEHGADINDSDLKGNNSLFIAACKGYSGFISLLAGHGVNVRSALADGRTPLMCAIQEGHLDTALVLLEHGAPVNARNNSGATALSDAARNGDVTAVHLLLAKGADPGSVNIPDSFMSFKGKIVAVNARKSNLGDVLKSIAKVASQDGYTINFVPSKEQVITYKSKGSWNKVLHELARKNNLVLVQKDNKLDVMMYDPAAIKREAL
jgi:ankyrin repeat protein